jgi:tellurite resistance-related uncharacterized protein
MKKWFAAVLLIGCIACSNQILPTPLPDEDMGLVIVTDEPPQFKTIGIDERVFDGVTALGASNEGCVFDATGPYNRVQTDPDKTGNINAVSATLALPKAPASEERNPKNPTQSRYTPNIYTGGKVGVLHGSLMYLLYDENGQIVPAHSVSAGLDYPGIGPEHSFYAESRVAEYVPITDAEALEGFKLLSECEGIIPALETAHAIAHLKTLAPELGKDKIIVVNLSGRGDKDVQEAMRVMGEMERSARA